jgi:hypothetical protein
MFPDDPDEMEEGNGIPEAIKDMMGNRDAIEALGAMIWYVVHLALLLREVQLTITSPGIYGN